MKKLRIAQIVNIWQSIPPEGYGGTEAVVYSLTEELVKRGHDVTLYATGDSKTSASLRSFLPGKLLHKKNIKWSNFLYPLNHFLRAYEEIKNSAKYDIIHGHYSLGSDLLSLAFAKMINIPSVFTLHMVLPMSDHQKDRKMLFDALNSLNFVSISDSQRSLPLLYRATVYHGLNLDNFNFTQNPTGDNLVWLGRVVPEKNLETAIAIAETLNKKIVVCGRKDDESPEHLEYFTTKIEPKLKSTNITYIEEVTYTMRNTILSQGKCFLFPIEWEEPFGLVMIEAMACGTPVVAYARGSVPEVVVDGVTGFVVEPEAGSLSDLGYLSNLKIKKKGLAGLCEAVERIYNMPDEEYRQMRLACRKHVEENFTVEKMVAGYEEVYRKVLGIRK